jgi:hypothetical protein
MQQLRVNDRTATARNLHMKPIATPFDMRIQLGY